MPALARPLHSTLSINGVTNVLKRLIPVLLLASGPALAGHYDYVEGGFIDVDRGNDSDAGARIAGSVDVAPAFALFGEFSDTGPVEVLSGGGLYHQPIARQLDLVLGGSMEAVEVGNADDVGFGVRGGLRWWLPNAPIEINPELRVVNVFDRTDTSLRVAGLLEFTPQVMIQSAVQAGDEDRLELGLRYRFGHGH